MRRVDDYRKNAQDCRDLAVKMPAEVANHLRQLASEWDKIADQRQRYLTQRASEQFEEPDPTP